MLVLFLLPLPVRAQPLPAYGIRDAVSEELNLDPAVPSQWIDVSAREGVVTLTGKVPHLLAKERATRVAAAVKGVRSVVNRITVDPRPLPSDEVIRQEVQTALRADPVTESSELSVQVRGGVVTLGGEVDSWQEAELARTVARRIRGVREVLNRIVVDPRTVRAEEEIRRDVEEALRWDVFVDAALIDVEVEDRTVKLSGTVGSAAEKLWARTDAYVAGVGAVDVSGLEVKPWARDPNLRAGKYLAQEDAKIRRAVESALLLDPRTREQEIRVAVDDAVVTLRGTTNDLQAKAAAEQDAWGTVGVLDVENRIRVAWRDEFTSEETERRIRGVLRRDPYLEHREINVGVSSGVARLSGSVDTIYEKTRASSMAGTVEGVVEVENGLSVTSPGPGLTDPFVEGVYTTYRNYPFEPVLVRRSDRRIRDDLADQLFWSPFLDAESIQISVEEGVVTLKGEVGTWAQREAAVKNAFDAGAVRVRNQLKVNVP